MLNICKEEKGPGICAIAGVTSGPIQPGKEDLQVTEECCDRKSVRYIARATAPHGRVYVLQGVGNKVLLLLSFSAHFKTWISLSQNNLSIILYLFYLFLLSLLAGKGNNSGFTCYMLF